MAKKKSGPVDAAIYVRTTPHLKKIIAENAAIAGESERWVVERLIESFSLMSSDSRLDVLQGRLAMHRSSQLVAIMAFANHAFAGEHYTWAIECYERLEAECSDQIYGGQPASQEIDIELQKEAEAKRRRQAERSPLRVFARYRQAYAWSELSLELRRKAHSIHASAATTGEPSSHSKRILEYFKAAREASIRAVEVYRSIEAIHPGTSLFCYNTACCASLAAMILVESALQYSGTSDAAVNRLSEAVRDDDRREQEKAWQTIGDKWRRLANGESKARNRFFGNTLTIGVPEIDEYGGLAIEYLSKLEIDPDMMADPEVYSGGIPWPDREYFPYRFWDDTDTLFLRTDANFRDSYSVWAGTADDDSLLKSFKRITKNQDRWPSR